MENISREEALEILNYHYKHCNIDPLDKYWLGKVIIYIADHPDIARCNKCRYTVKAMKSSKGKQSSSRQVKGNTDETRAVESHDQDGMRYLQFCEQNKKKDD